MEIVFYDVESTGLGKLDEVIQLAGVITDMNLNITGVFNRFCWTNTAIQDEARAKHGIDAETLFKYSEGKFLEQWLDSELSFFRKKSSVIFSAYNDHFDRNMINQTLSNNGSDTINFGKKIHTIDRSLTTGRYNLDACQLMANTINNGIKWTLESYTHKKTGIPYDQFLSMYERFCKSLKITVPIKANHDALFDVFVMWYIVGKNRALMYT